MGRYWVPCPHCDEYQVLVWEQVKYDPYNIKGTVHYQCISCREKIFEYMKTQMLDAGQWIHERPEETDVLGFHISSLYSPVGWYSWTEAAVDYELALKANARMKTFVNTKLGLTFRESGETPDFQRIYERREDYQPKTLVPGAQIICAGIDVQKDRVEVLVCCFSKDKQRWLMDYAVFQGDVELDEVWDETKKYLDQEWKVAGSEFTKQIDAIAIDTGFATMRVTKFAKRFSKYKMFPIKGSTLGATFIGTPRQGEAKTNGRKIKTGLRIWNINVDIAKGELFRQLLLPVPEDGKEYPPGFFHFNKYQSLEWMKGLCSEELRFKEQNGFKRWYYAKVYTRNEPLDTANYARAALSILGGDRWKDQKWDAIEAGLHRTERGLYDHAVKKVKPEVIERKAEAVEIEIPPQEPLRTVTKPQNPQRGGRLRARKKSSFW